MLMVTMEKNEEADVANDSTAPSKISCAVLKLDPQSKVGCCASENYGAYGDYYRESTRNIYVG
jgi:hypothetical protein